MDKLDLTCHYCNNILDDPVLLLNCSHNVCRHCASANEKNNEVICPQCGVPSDYSTLAPVPMLSQLIKMTVAQRGPIVISCFDSPVEQDLKTVSSSYICPEHNKKRDIFDWTTKQLICPHCALYNTPKSNRTVSALAAVDQAALLLKKISETQNQQIFELGKRIEATENLHGIADKNHELVISQIRRNFAELRDLIDDREKELLQQARAQYKDCTDSLEAITSKLKNYIHKIDKESSEREAALNSKDPYKILPLVSTLNTLKDEVAVTLTTVNPDQRVCQKVTLITATDEMIKCHGRLELQVPEIEISGEIHLESLSWDSFDAAMEIISTKRNLLGQMIDVITEKSEIEEAQLKRMEALSALPVPCDDRLPAVEKLWRIIVNEKTSAFGEAVAKNAKMYMDVIVKNLEDTQADLDKQSAEIASQCLGIRKELERQLASAKKCLSDITKSHKEVMVLQQALLDAKSKGGSVKKQQLKISKALSSYQTTYVNYTNAVRSYNSSKQNLEAELKTLYGRLEELEIERVDTIHRCSEDLESIGVNMIGGIQQYLAEIKSFSRSIDPKVSISGIVKNASREGKRMVIDGDLKSYDIDLPEFNSDPLQTNINLKVFFNQETTPKPITVTQEAETLAKAEVVKSYSRQSSEELSIDEGDVLEVLQYEDGNMVKTRSNKGEIGSVPSDTIKVLTEPASPQETPLEKNAAIMKARCMYAYDANEEDEISISVGDVCIVHEYRPASWSEIEINGVRGCAPTAYLEIIQNE